MTSEERASLTKVAASVVDTLRSQPLMLTLLVLNALVLAAVTYNVRQERALRYEMTKIDQATISRALELLVDCQRK